MTTTPSWLKSGDGSQSSCALRFNLIYQSINKLQSLKPKTGDRIAAISRLVPGAGQFSNPLFANLDEFKALKESLKREGVFDETWETLVLPRNEASSPSPYRP